MKRFFLAMAVAAMTVALPSPAAAGDSAAVCNFNPANHQVTMQVIGKIEPFVAISRDVYGHIFLGGLSCGEAATVMNTDSIMVTGNGDHQTLVIELANGGFRPGFTNESGKSDEIEFTIDMGLGYDIVSVMGTDAVQKIVLGQGSSPPGIVRRINLNAGEGTGIDSDISLFNTELAGVQGEGGNDVIQAVGGKGTGPDPFGLPLSLYGNNGNDEIRGGSAADWLQGGLGVDQIWGNKGWDEIHIEDMAGGDIAYGGKGLDTCFKDDGDTRYCEMGNGL